MRQSALHITDTGRLEIQHDTIEATEPSNARSFVRPTASPMNEFELAVRELHRQQGKVLQVFNDGLWAFDCHGKTKFVSDQTAILLGYSPAEMLSKPFNEYLGEQGRRATREFFSGRGARRVARDLELFGKGGKRCAVRMKFVAFTTERGAHLGVIASVERRRTETNAPDNSSRELFYRGYFESSRDCIALLSQGGWIESLNPAFARLTGWECAAWIGKQFDGLVQPSSRRAVRAALVAAARGQEVDVVEFEAATQAGTFVPCELSLTPQRAGGFVVGLLASVRDISARKKVEEDLRQSQKVESLGRLSGGIAHDFNNILGIISAHASLFKFHKSSPEKLEADFSTITRQTERATSLVKQLMTFARKTEVKLEPVDLNKEVSDLAHMLRETMPRTIEIETELNPGLPLIQADRIQLHQAILNLCVNARDAIRERTEVGTITIRTADQTSKPRTRPTQQQERPCISVSVSDTGVGMTKEVQQKIFEPFFTTKEVGKGTGLGLAVVHGVVAGFGGSLEVESTIGRGTTFTAFLPVAEHGQNSVEANPVPDAEEPMRSGTVLVVEDEGPLLTAVQTQLVENGFTVFIARDPLEAIKTFAVEQASIDMVVSDNGLPRQSGRDLLVTLKRMKPGLKAILASGYMEEAECESLERSGIDGYIQKPYSTRQLFDTIDAVREGRKVV